MLLPSLLVHEGGGDSDLLGSQWDVGVLTASSVAGAVEDGDGGL